MAEPRVSHGRPSRIVSIGSYRLTEACYARDQRVARHEHAFPSWTFVLSGSFQESFTRETHTCAAGSVLTKPSTADHSNRYGTSGAHCLIIEMLSPETAGRELSTQLFMKPRIFAEGLVPRLARQIQSEFGTIDRLTTFAVEGLLIELSVASSRVAQPDRRISPKRWLNDVRDQLEAEFRSPPSLTDLASSHNLHPVYLCQQFRAAFGVSIGEFARSVRFEWARECLANQGASISSIALAAGFSDQAHFSRDFKARTGMSPRRYQLGRKI